jgi:hypothetical protein
LIQWIRWFRLVFQDFLHTMFDHHFVFFINCFGFEHSIRNLSCDMIQGFLERSFWVLFVFELERIEMQWQGTDCKMVAIFIWEYLKILNLMNNFKSLWSQKLNTKLFEKLIKKSGLRKNQAGFIFFSRCVRTQAVYKWFEEPFGWRQRWILPGLIQGQIFAILVDTDV